MDLPIETEWPDERLNSMSEVGDRVVFQFRRMAMVQWEMRQDPNQ
jgi:hypothetical protein